MSEGFDLETLQRWMHGTLLERRGASADAAASRLLPNQRLSAQERLSIYQRSYALRIAACMREQFPALCRALGKSLFNAFVADYVRRFPPESYTLHDLGRRFSQFLEETRPDRDQEDKEVWFDLMVDLARFERQVFVTFDGPGAPDETLASSETPPERLVANPSMSVAAYGFDLGPYFHGLCDEDETEESVVGPPDPSASHYVVLRRGERTYTMPAARQAAAVLSRVCTGATLAEVLAESGLSDPSLADAWAVDQLGTQGWINMGAFCDAARLTIRGEA